MSDKVRLAHYHDLDALLRTAWSMVEQGVGDRTASFHIAQVATVDGAGMPAVRSVVLRGFDSQSLTLRFHTDIRSGKVDEIRAQPAIAIHLYDRFEKVQLRLSCLAGVHYLDDVTAAAWQAMRPMSQECYGQQSSPGTALSVPDGGADITAAVKRDAVDNFAVVTARIRTLEWLYLSASGHRRAFFDFRTGQETQTWLAP